MLVEDVTIRVQDVDSCAHSMEVNNETGGEVDSTIALKTEALNERLENLLDQQIFNTVESDLAQHDGIIS